MKTPYDPGLQGERTALAWTRTALALALAGAFVTRLTVERGGILALALGVIAVALSVVMGVLARARYDNTSASLHESGALLSDGRILAVAAGGVLAAGAAAALFVGCGMLDA